MVTYREGSLRQEIFGENNDGYGATYALSGDYVVIHDGAINHVRPLSTIEQFKFIKVSLPD